MGENRNFLLAAVIAIGILFLYQAFILDPMARDREAAEQAAAESQVQDTGDDAPQASDASFAAGLGENGMSREDALARSQRIEIRTEALAGSLSLTGARIDDLHLLRYETEVDSDEPVTLMSPEGFDGYQFAASGWLGGANAPQGLPGLSTEWTLVEGNVLSVDSPVVLEHTAGDLTFRRTISIDENYLFTVNDTVVNNGSAAVSLRPYALVRQHGVPADLQNFFVLHEGAVGVVDGTHFSRKFKKWEDEGLIERNGPGGWMGITSKYWLAAVAPADQSNVRAQFRVVSRPDRPVFESNYLSDAQTLPPGASLESTNYVFAGAKKQPILAAYERDLGIERLTQAIDWGMFWFMTRPFFAALHFFYGLLGNYGLAIMVVTLLIKLVLFPLNNRAFASMAKMRAAAPKMTEIRERHKDDPQAQQKAMMELYRKERINPVAGCLPILPQIPIFFALYKTVFISLDARHAPFFGWIQDMSAPDPTMIGNLFGLLPYDPSGFPIVGPILAIGIWPLLMGVTMWAQQSLNPPPPDKIQRQIFAFMPIIFTIIMAPFPAALIIYWSWNNTLTIGQQYLIMRRQGVVTELDRNFFKLREKLTGKATPAKYKGEDTPTATNQVIEGKVEEAVSDMADDANADDVATEGETPADAKSETKPAPTGRRVSSNPAAKKPRGGKKK
ncbi:membrane protein insertase YidC [Oceanicaulis sp. MMSF_3324]|uniref:membrane protein insertase YidC n=1 Tax=Oceanicaulis sp. MMSF_3324 TaxID=3046702 RepID=UPI00273DA836|nr:membrane protein insertase YidC [Oceanicaulis sp. MMSF_3324]